MYSVISVKGPERIVFLQGQLTQDVDALEAAGSLRAAWCTAKGRVFATMKLVHETDHIVMVLPADIAPAVMQRLGMYKLRSDVAFELSAEGAPDADESPETQIAAGRVVVGAAASERFTPHMLNLDLTEAVSFTKGCYTGQEIVARTENLGKPKRRVNRYRIDGTLPAIGDKLELDGKTVGEVVSAAGIEFLAVVPIDKHGERVTAGGTVAVPQPLPYALE